MLRTLSFGTLMTAVFSLALPALASDRIGPTLCRTASLGQRYPAVVVRVVDGDTVKVRNTEGEFNVRMLSIDTPEKNYQGRNQGVWADRATENLADILPTGTQVQIELDVQPCDRYGRVLGYVWKGEIDVNRAQLEDGMAVSYCIAPNEKHCADYIAPVEAAVAARLGIFGDNTVELPYEWRRRVAHRAYDQFVGDQVTFKVYAPGQNQRVPIARRIFFYEESDIHAPYRRAR